jgi:1-acyl-sn-glycerol-3-phosphate acyltransferase
MPQFSLLATRRFWPFFWTQFLGAFNDNFFKNALVILITFRAADVAGLNTEQMVALCGGVFILPFFLFSATAGQLADKYPKSTLVRYIKFAEIFVMLVAAIGFFINSIELLLVVLFFMGLQSAFFGPVKYGILPQLLKDRELVGGNALIQMATFLAILTGTIAGGILIESVSNGALIVSVGIVLVAIAGFTLSRFVIPLPSEEPSLRIEFNPITPTYKIYTFTRQFRSIFLSILAISWFWFFGASFLALLPPYGKNLLSGSPQVVTYFLALFSIGIGIGSILCGRLSGDKLELGLVPIGSFGMTVFMFDLFLIGDPYRGLTRPEHLLSISEFLQAPAAWRISFDLLMLSAFGGFYIVPLQTLIQERSEASHRARVIAGNNILNAFFMVLSTVMLIALYRFEFTVPQIFLVVTLLNMAVAIYVFTVIPEFMYRFLCWVLANITYRLKTTGLENIPNEGPVVLACNHVSFVDWLIISSACRRPARFVMHHSFMKIPLMGWLFRSARVIPIASVKESPKTLKASFDSIAEALDNGEVVCIFPEGRITHTGELNEFRSGIARIVERNPAPVVPMALSGLYGSLFSREKSKGLRNPFRWLWSHVRLTVGPAIPPDTLDVAELKKKVLEMRGDVR